MIDRHRTSILFGGVALAVLAGCGATADQPVLPDVVGMTLDTAEQTVQDAGWNDVSSHDVLRSRTQIVDSNWQVCDQTPVAGPADADAEVDLGVVRTDETCPGQTPTTTTTPSPSTTRPLPTTVPRLTTPSVPTAVPVPDAGRQPEPDRNDDSGSSDGTGSSGHTADDPDAGGSDVGTVNPGSYCGTPGAVGVTSSGTPMVCAPGSDGRDRWRSS